MEDAEKIAKRNRLGNTKKPSASSILRDEQGNVLQFRHPEDVMFVFCQNCGHLFTANITKAGNLVYVASLFAEMEKKDFPQNLLEEHCDYTGYYIEIGKCEDCNDTNKTRIWIKRIPD